MKQNIHTRPRKGLSPSTKAGILLVVVAALTLEATSLIQYFYSVKGLEEEASKRAETQLEATRNEIMDVIDQTETAIRNSVWIAQWSLTNYPDSLARVSRRIVRDNPVILGSAMALNPDVSQKLFAPYIFRQGDSLVTRSLATPEYDYPSKEWFRKPLELDGEYWSEPYFDTGGGEVLMTTFSCPVKDLSDRPAAVLTADIYLDWLTDIVGSIRIYPNATILLISRTGRFMVSKTKELVMEKSVIEVVDEIRGNEDFQILQQAMLSGESGKMTMKYEGEKSHVFFCPGGADRMVHVHCHPRR